MEGGTATKKKRGSGSLFILFLVFSFVCVGILVLITKYSPKSKYILPDDDNVFLILLFLISFLFGALRQGTILLKSAMRHTKVFFTERFTDRSDREQCDKSPRA